MAVSRPTTMVSIFFMVFPFLSDATRFPDRTICLIVRPASTLHI